MNNSHNPSWSFDDDFDDDEISSSVQQPAHPKQPHSNIPNVENLEKDDRSRTSSNDDDNDDDDEIRTHDSATTKAPDATAQTPAATKKKTTSKCYDSFSDDSDSSFEEHLRALQITDSSTANDDTVRWTNLWNAKNEDDPSNKEEKELDENVEDDDDDSVFSIPANRQPPPAATTAIHCPSTQPQTVECRSDKSSNGDDDDSYRLDDSLDVENDYPGTAWKWLPPPTEEYTLVSTTGSSSMTYPPYRIPSSLYDCLYEHQKSGVQFMAGLHNGGIGGILGDDMGMVSSMHSAHTHIYIYKYIYIYIAQPVG